MPRIESGPPQCFTVTMQSNRGAPRGAFSLKGRHHMTTSRTLRPGLLVSLKSTVTGGVRYDRKDLAAKTAETIIPGVSTVVEKWETTKVIENADEFERATQVRGKCRTLVTAVCAASDFGLLCPASREFDLARAIEEAKRIAAEHNRTATRSFVSVYVITGRIAADDAEAARAVASEVRGLVEEMEAGVKAADPEAIRKAANKAKNLGAMLTDDASAKVQSAIESARVAARDIVRRVEKGGEEAAKVIAEMDLAALSAARGAFLDLDDVKPTEAQPVDAAALDLAPAANEPAERLPAKRLEPTAVVAAIDF